MGALAFLGMGIVFGAAIVLAAAGSEAYPGFLVWLEGLGVGLAVLGLAVTVASLLSGFRHRLVTLLGLVASSLILLAWLAFALLL